MEIDGIPLFCVQVHYVKPLPLNGPIWLRETFDEANRFKASQLSAYDDTDYFAQVDQQVRSMATSQLVMNHHWINPIFQTYGCGSTSPSNGTQAKSGKKRGSQAQLGKSNTMSEMLLKKVRICPIWFLIRCSGYDSGLAKDRQGGA